MMPEHNQYDHYETDKGPVKIRMEQKEYVEITKELGMLKDLKIVHVLEHPFHGPSYIFKDFLLTNLVFFGS